MDRPNTSTLLMVVTRDALYRDGLAKLSVRTEQADCRASRNARRARCLRIALNLRAKILSPRSIQAQHVGYSRVC